MFSRPSNMEFMGLLQNLPELYGTSSLVFSRKTVCDVIAYFLWQLLEAECQSLFSGCFQILDVELAARQLQLTRMDIQSRVVDESTTSSHGTQLKPRLHYPASGTRGRIVTEKPFPRPVSTRRAGQLARESSPTSNLGTEQLRIGDIVVGASENVFRSSMSGHDKPLLSST